MSKDKTKEDDNQVDERRNAEDSSDQLSTAIDWDHDKTKVPVQTTLLAMAQIGDDDRRPSPFRPKKDVPAPEPPKTEVPKPGGIPAELPKTDKPGGDKVEPPKGDGQKPLPGKTEPPKGDTSKPNPTKPDSSDKNDTPKSPALEKIRETEFLKNLPAGTIDCTQRAFEALKAVRPGQPLTDAQRKVFDEALKDASKPLPSWINEQQTKLINDVQSKIRVLPNGAELPPWTPEKEKEFVLNLKASQKAFNEMSPTAQKKVGDLEALIGQLPKDDTIRRGVFQRMLNEEGGKDGKIKAYLDQKTQSDKFVADNALGLVRRDMHQQELSLLHSQGVVSGLYAIALDRAGQKSDQKQIEKLVLDSVRDRFAPANIPEIIELAQKYKLEDKEIQSIESKVHGYGDMKKAQSIMADASQGTVTERLAKAREFFEKAIGAADLVDQKKTNDEIEALTKQRTDAGEGITQDKLNELENKAVELVAKARLGYEARMSFALALQQASVESKNPALNEQCVNMLKAIETMDPAYKLDSTVQGALIIAQKQPPENIDLNTAAELGKPAVEKIKEEMRKAGQKPEDTPGWLRALKFAGETLVGIAAFHLVGKYIFRPIGNLKNNISRSWEMSSRVKNIEAEQTPSLKPGEEPRVTLKTKDGKEYPVEGVRAADGKLRVFDGEKTAVMKVGKGDSLYVKVAPDSNLTKEQVKELAAKKLAPVGDEAIIGENQQRYKEELQIRDKEIEALKAANEEMQRKLAGGAEAEKQFAPTATEKLEVAKSLLNEQTVQDFHEAVEKASGELKEVPADSSIRLKDTVFDFLKNAGINDSNLNADRTEFTIDKEKTKVEVSYSTGDGAEAKEVSKQDGKFFLGDGKTEVSADKVQTHVSVPEGMLRGNVGELSKSLYVSLLEHSSTGTSANARSDRAGMYDFVSKSLSKHVSLPSDIGTLGGSNGSGSIELTKLPVLDTKVAELEIGDRGVKIGGIDREISFVEIWTEKVNDLKARLAAEEGKKENERDAQRIAELKTAIASETKLIAQLSDPKSQEHAKAVERVKESMRGFRATEGEIERLAREKGPGGEARGRLVALTILASAFLAWREKSNSQ